MTRRLHRALDIAATAVRRLAERGYTDPEDPAQSVRPEKVVAETAVLLVVTRGLDEPGIAARRDRVADLLAPHARGRTAALGLCLRPSLAGDHGLAHACLAALDRPDPRFETLLSRAEAAQAAGGRERVPHRVMEVEWQRRLRGLPASSDATAMRSVLAHPLDLYGATREDLYALTHAVMYATDLGARPTALPVPAPPLLDQAEALLARCLDTEDYDLAGELLLAWPQTGTPFGPVSSFAWQVLAEVEDRAGFLPTGATRLDRAASLQGEARAAYLSATAYHTAYVMGLLCAAALRPGCAPPPAIPPGSAMPGAADALLPLMPPPGERTPHWEATFQHLPATPRDALAPLLLAVALHRAVEERAFGTVGALLRTALDFGLADCAAASQAAELLDRLALLADATN